MNEQAQAELLARWLEAPAGTPPPEGLDGDVVEAAFVLRPALARPARPGLAEVLAAVRSGPYADPDAPASPEEIAEAAALSAWLEGGPPPGTGASEAATALRPDLARPYAVDLDSILASVTIGPFATPVSTETLPPAIGEEPEPFTAANRPFGRTRRAWWAIPGAVLAAAAALLLVVPASREVPVGFPAAEAPLAAGAPEAKPAAAPLNRPTTSPTPDRWEEAQRPAEPAMPAPPPAIAELDAAPTPVPSRTLPGPDARGVEGEEGLGQAGRTGVAGGPAAEEAASAKEPAGAGDGKVREYADDLSPAPAAEAPSRDAATTATTAEMATSASPAISAVPASGTWYTPADAPPEAVEAEVGATRERQDHAEKKRGTAVSRPRASIRSVERAQDEAGPATQKAGAHTLDEAGAASPSTPAAAAFAPVDAALARGDEAAAIALLDRLRTGTDATLAAEAAWRLASLHRAAGRAAEATAVVEAALARADLPAAWRARLEELR